MTPANSKQIVLAATLTVVAVSTVKALRKGDAPRPAVFLGAAVGAFGLGLVAGPSPTLAATFAGLWATSSLINGGDVVAVATTAAIKRKNLPRKDR